MRSPKPFPLLPLLSVLSVIQIATATNAATWYVDASAISGAGTSWNEPFNTIGEAVAAAGNGDSVWVAEGVYAESVQIEKPLQILGGFQGDEVSIHNRVISPTDEDGTFITHSDFPALRILSSVEFSDMRLTGFTVTNATNVMVSNILVQDRHIPTGGGGCLFTNSEAILTSCRFLNNSASFSGGGIMIQTSSTVTLRDCVIRENDSEAGGGVAVIRSNLVMSNCRIEQNRAISLSGDNEGIAGGLYSVNSLVNVENCLFIGNIAPVGNQFTGLNSQGQPITFTNCTFYTPFAGPHPQIVWARLAVPTIQNSIVMGDIPIEHRSDENLLANVTHSNIQGGYPGEGNISDDPQFVDPANGDFRLQHNSPCIDAGAMAGPADDLDGNPRPIDIPGVGREGDNAFDMGAFEFQLPILSPDPRTDINQDGLRDGTDLLLLMQDWMRVSGASGN